MQVQQDPENLPFAQFLLRVGEGTLLTSQIPGFLDHDRIPGKYVYGPTNVVDGNSALKQLIIYLSIETAVFLPEDMVMRAILMPLNTEVNKINDIATEMLHGSEITTYPAQDSLEDEGDNAARYPAEYLNTMTPSG
ncbi:hypothetical protein BGZ49_001002 [Haplosporangium sp. Z 27]|nr:hypothetical protein BGZ49_001002 [Haplosporangium sp. Z 27]